MKFFTLLYGKEVHIAPDTKVIPASEFSELIDGSKLVETIKQEGARYKEEIAKEGHIMQEKAQKEGYKAGLDAWSSKLAEFEKTLKSAKEETEKMIIPVALKAARKIVGREMELNPSLVVDIVKESLKAVAQHHRFTIYVNKQDFPVIDTNRPKLKEVLESVESLTVKIRDDIKPGDATIETEGGIINVQLEQLWQSLETAFLALLKEQK